MYLGDYTVNDTRFKTTVLRSSYPVGIVALVDGDHDSGTTSVNVTNTKYIYETDSLEVYRGNSYITTLTITAKTQTAITVNTTGENLLSSDELWVAGTYNGPKVFRWANPTDGGTTEKQYDVFKLTGNDTSEITMMENIGDVQVIATKNHLATWNDSYLRNYDLGVGVCAKGGYVKAFGVLFFLHYTGMYATTEERPQLISSKVEKYFTGATKEGLENATLGKKNFSIFACIGDVTLYKNDGSTDKTLSDVCLEYNTRQENWYVHTNVPAEIMSRYETSLDPDRLIFAHADNFEIYDFLQGFDDNGSEIAASLTIQPLTLAAPEFEKIVYPLNAIIETEAGSSVKVFVSLDGGQFYEAQSEAQKGCSIVAIGGKHNPELQPRCRKLSLSIREFSKRAFRLGRVSLTYLPSLESESQKD